MRYGYSNTRAKAMESKLIDIATMRSIAEAKDVDSILAILFQTDYNAAITKFGGLEISATMIDFAISENLAERVNKLAEITPKRDQHIIRRIIARWDLSNVKRVLEAAERKQPFEAISRYLIGSSEFPPAVLQDAMRAESVEAVLAKLIQSSLSYRPILERALAVYKKSKNVLDAMATLDAEHYRQLGELAIELQENHDKSAQLLRMDIDMRNMITLLRAKRLGSRFDDVSYNLISNGDIGMKALAKMYNGASDVASFASKSQVFELADAVEAYKQNGQMLSFEISMRNQIFNTSRKMLRLSVALLRHAC